LEKIEHIIRRPERQSHKPPLFFQHGAWHGAWCWDWFLDYFSSKGYKVHAMSLPGHGASSMEKGHINRYSFNDYVGCLAGEIAKVSPAPILVGHSLGGALVQKVLETHHLPGAVLLASVPASGMARALLRWLRNWPGPMVKTTLRLDYYALVETPELARELFLSRDTSVDVEEFQKRLVRESFLAGLPLVLPTTLRSERVNTPALVVAGEDDRLFSVEEERQTAEALRGEFRLFEGQAHNLMMDSAWQVVAEAIEDWIPL